MYRNFILKMIFVSICLFTNSNSWRYDGYLFDAMAQIDERVNIYKSIRKVKKQVWAKSPYLLVAENIWEKMKTSLFS